MKLAALSALACAVGLALIAFWPSLAREVRIRPAIEGAVVFDELQPTAPAPAPAP